MVVTRAVAHRLRAARCPAVAASKDAETAAIGTVSAATAQREAAVELAEADRARTVSEAGRIRSLAEADSEREKLQASTLELRSGIEAAARRAMNEADAGLSQDLIDMKVRLSIIEHLQGIIAESVKPMEQIDGIKIVRVDGLAPTAGSSGGPSGGEQGLSDEIVSSALRYRAHAPVLDQLLRDVGFEGGDPKELQQALTRMMKSGDGKEADET